MTPALTESRNGLRLYRRLLRAGALVAILAGCTQASAPPPAGPGLAAAGVTAPGFTLPEGSGCAGEIARFRAVLDNDLATGHVGAAVHARASAELDKAAKACSAGSEGDADRIVRTTKARFGYP